MTSESETIADTRNKNRRSSDGEAEENTKRRKHKHRHHRHHHRSKKRDEKAEDEVGELEDVDVKKMDDDMEEGEIVEEDGEKLNMQHALGADAVDNPNSAGSRGGEMGRRDSDGRSEKTVMDNDRTGLEDGVNGNDFVSISDNSEEKHKRSIHSPYPIESPYEHGVRKRSGSYNPHDISGSHSRSDVENVDTLKAKQFQDWDIDHKSFRKYANESEEEISFRHDHSEHLRPSRSRARDEEREPSVNYSRYADRRDREYAKDVIPRDRDDGDVERVHGHERDRGSSRDERREKERKKSRTREQEKDRSHRTDRNQDRQMEQDAGGKVDMKSSLITERERNRGRERNRHRDTEIVERQYKRERDHYKIKEKDKGRERERSVERARDRDMSLDRARYGNKEGSDLEGKTKERSTERDREKERARVRSDDRARERRREGSYREREHRQEKSRDRNWNAGQLKYDDGSSKREHPSEYERDGNSYIQDQDKTKPEYTSRLDRSTDYIGASEETPKREEEENEEYQEKISLRLAEEEDDDINRIKEESRRRREAILEKYRNLKLQDQSSAEIHKGNEQENLQIHQSELLISSSEAVYVKPGGSFDVAKSQVENGDSAAEHTGTRGLGEGTPKSERPDDMFCDDIFGDTPTGLRKAEKRDGLPIERSGLHDNWDDADGYYSYRFGELLDGRYEIKAAHGKGVFSSVVRAKDLKAGHGEPEEVAIKIIRNNETMFKAGQSELVILKKLVGADPEDRRHCVRFLSSFKYRNHLCLVFESLNMNLREVLKKFGRNIGLKLTAVRVYAKQLLIALKHLRNCGVLHCDIKPDNMLVNESKNVLKLCDFGNAMFAGKNEITPYLVSRFYRAPEIILGLTYDHPVDIWSVGCCLYELYTGKVLFPGATNNDMLRLHLELKGPFPKKMLRKGAFTEHYFDQDLNFLSLEDDPVTKKTIKRVMVNIKPKDIGSILTGSAGEDSKMLTNFKDLLDKIFMLDPDKRMTVSQALGHPFITGK